MKDSKWTPMQLLSRQERFQYQQLKDLVTKFELALDFRIWRKSQWLEKGSSYALLLKAYQLLDNFEYRYRMFALALLYDPNFQKYMAEDKSYLQDADTDQVLYLLKMLTNYQDPISQLENIKTSQTINLGFRRFSSRFQQFTQNIGNLMKQKGCDSLKQPQLRQYAKELWSKIMGYQGNFRRQQRIEQVANELQMSLRYERMRMDIIKQIIEQQHIKSSDSTPDFRGPFLREIIQKKQLRQIGEAFSRFNSQLYKKQKNTEKMLSYTN